ncbi:MAG: Holliday junction resolvasome RuvABC DNA-binding subunit [Paraglaciecola sp.]|jgi:Holliday junction resolvasome RuvABC DNA-binding subunit
MSFIIGIIGEKNNDLVISIPKIGKYEPLELCTSFTYELEDDSKPYSHSDRNEMYDGFDFKKDRKLLQKGYNKEEANKFLSKIIADYESYGEAGIRDLKPAIEMKEIINSAEFKDIDSVYFIEIRFEF